MYKNVISDKKVFVFLILLITVFLSTLSLVWLLSYRGSIVLTCFFSDTWMVQVEFEYGGTRLSSYKNLDFSNMNDQQFVQYISHSDPMFENHANDVRKQPVWDMENIERQGAGITGSDLIVNMIRFPVWLFVFLAIVCFGLSLWVTKRIAKRRMDKQVEWVACNETHHD